MSIYTYTAITLRITAHLPPSLDHNFNPPACQQAGVLGHSTQREASQGVAEESEAPVPQQAFEGHLSSRAARKTTAQRKICGSWPRLLLQNGG